MDAATAGHDAAHQQGTVHVIAAGDEQGMADAGPAQIVHQRGEVGDGVCGAVIEVQARRRHPLALLEQPAGVLGVGAAADYHRQAVLAGQAGGHPLALGVAAEHQDHLGRGRLRQPPAPGQPQQTRGRQSQRQQPPAGAAARPTRTRPGPPPGRPSQRPEA